MTKQNMRFYRVSSFFKDKTTVRQQLKCEKLKRTYQVSVVMCSMPWVFVRLSAWKGGLPQKFACVLYCHIYGSYFRTPRQQLSSFHFFFRHKTIITTIIVVNTVTYFKTYALQTLQQIIDSKHCCHDRSVVLPSETECHIGDILNILGFKTENLRYLWVHSYRKDYISASVVPDLGALFERSLDAMLRYKTECNSR